MKIALIHPDLGIGGAERLVVDLALALQNKNHQVAIFTSHHDSSHCFEETRDGSLKVAVLGNTIFPRNIFGKLSIFCAIARQLHLTRMLSKSGLNFDVFIVDQLSACVPFLRIAFPKARILFYCHHPDLLLTERKSIVKKLYRIPFDKLEKATTLQSDLIVVNSKYTGTVFEKVFHEKSPEVLYPAVDTDDKPVTDWTSKRQVERIPFPFFLSINRFERKKNIELAIEAYATLLHSVKETHDSLLVIAGGYDERVRENVDYLSELRQMCTKYRMGSMIVLPGMEIAYDKSTRVLFLPSMSNAQKQALLSNARMLLYTPENEHFGIVPLEAMRVGTPVLATNTGGPTETIVDGECGFLRPPDVEEWYNVLGWALLTATEDDLKRMGDAGKKRVQDFSLTKLEGHADYFVKKTAEVPRDPSAEVILALQVKILCAFMAVLAAIGCVLGYEFVRFLIWLWPYFLMTTRF